MLSINSNINSLVAQENLNGSGSALSQAITRLSSGKRINSAADDSAGLAISTTLQTQINGLNQGVSNANDGVSIVQTASTGLSQITSSLQRIRTLAVEASSGSLSASDQASLQQEVSQQIQEVNRIASQTTYNGINLLNGSAGAMNFQVGANVGQTISVNLGNDVQASSLGTGNVQKGATLGSIAVSVDSTGAAWNPATSTGTEITQINVLSDGNGGYSFTDQNNQTLSTAAGGAVQALFGATPTTGTLTAKAGSAVDPTTELAAINTANAGLSASQLKTAGISLGTIGGINIDATTGADIAGNPTSNSITSITAKTDGNGGFTLVDQNGNALSSTAQAALFGTSATATTPGTAGTLTLAGAAPASNLAAINANNNPPTVANIDVSTSTGASTAIESIDNALASINNIQATLGAAQNRLTGIAQSQQNESTDLSSAQSQMTDADFAQETANMSKAQVLQQAGISVLAQANSTAQQVLKLLQ